MRKLGGACVVVAGGAFVLVAFRFAASGDPRAAAEYNGFLFLLLAVPVVFAVMWLWAGVCSVFWWLVDRWQRRGGREVVVDLPGVERSGAGLTGKIGDASTKGAPSAVGLSAPPAAATVDATAVPGRPVRAIGNAKVLGVAPDWYVGQPYVYYELLDGSREGEVIYVPEQAAPTVRSGDFLRAGQAIGTVGARSSSGVL